MTDRRKMLEHAGGFERVIRYALQDLDEETFAAFIGHMIASIADVQAGRLDEAWKRAEP